MKKDFIEALLWGDDVIENVRQLKLPRKIKKSANKLMYNLGGIDGYCFPPRYVVNKYSRKLISICDNQTTYFKIGNMLFSMYKGKYD